jgi:hypothetical protein
VLFHRREQGGTFSFNSSTTLPMGSSTTITFMVPILL